MTEIIIIIDGIVIITVTINIDTMVRNT